MRMSSGVTESNIRFLSACDRVIVLLINKTLHGYYYTIPIHRTFGMFLCTKWEC